MKEVILCVLVFMLTACASDYPCGEPRAGRCSSVTENYHNSLHGVVNPEDLPVNKHYAGCKHCSVALSSGNKEDVAKYLIDNKYPQIPSNNSPLLSTPSMMRVWYAPFVDSDNVYHDQEYQYMIIDRGHWLYGANRVYGRSAGAQGGTLLVQSNNGAEEDPKPEASQTSSKFNTPGLDFLQQRGRLGMGN